VEETFVQEKQKRRELLEQDKQAGWHKSHVGVKELEVKFL
jgi:hypothetical protein